MFLYMWLSLWNKAEVFETPLLEARHREVLENWKIRELTDVKAFSLVENWHKLPDIAQKLEFHGVPMGICMEYEMTRMLLIDGYHAFG